MDRRHEGLVLERQMIRLEDGREVALSALIEDARRRRGADIRRLVLAGMAAAQRMLGRAKSVRARPRAVYRSAPALAVAATAAFRSDEALGHFAGTPVTADAAQPAVGAVAAERAPDQLAA